MKTQRNVRNCWGFFPEIKEDGAVVDVNGKTLWTPPPKPEPKLYRVPNPIPGMHIDYNLPPRTVDEKLADYRAMEKWRWETNPGGMLLGKILFLIFGLGFAVLLYGGIALLVMSWKVIAIALVGILAGALYLGWLIWVIPGGLAALGITILLFRLDKKVFSDESHKKK